MLQLTPQHLIAQVRSQALTAPGGEGKLPHLRGVLIGLANNNQYPVLGSADDSGGILVAPLHQLDEPLGMSGLNLPQVLAAGVGYG